MYIHRYISLYSTYFVYTIFLYRHLLKISASIRCIFDDKALIIARMSSRKTLIHYLSMTSSSFSCTTFTFQNGEERREKGTHMWNEFGLAWGDSLGDSFGSSFLTWAIFNWGEWRQVQSSVLYGCTLDPLPANFPDSWSNNGTLSLCLFCCPSVLLCCFLRQSLIRGSHLVFNKCSVFMLTIRMGKVKRNEAKGNRVSNAKLCKQDEA